MSETITFVDCEGYFEWTVKKEFAQVCPNYLSIKHYNLFTEHKLNQYLHNPNGPAIKRMKDGYEDYWINGKHLNPEEAAKMKHDVNFDKQFMDGLNDTE